MTATLERPRTAAEPIILRTNWGSHRVVSEVLALDAIGGIAFVRFAPQFSGDITEMDRVLLTELEALDANGRYVRPVEGVVRSMCGEVCE